MTLMDPIGDMFTRLRNGQMRLLETINVPSSTFRQKILDILKSEGFIKNYYIEKLENNKINLKVYSRATSIPKVMNGLGVAILSTPKGVMTDNDARKNNLGGEIICKVF